MGQTHDRQGEPCPGLLSTKSPFTTRGRQQVQQHRIYGPAPWRRSVAPLRLANISVDQDRSRIGQQVEGHAGFKSCCPDFYTTQFAQGGDWRRDLNLSRAHSFPF
jgi:hypothetical protein